MNIYKLVHEVIWRLLALLVRLSPKKKSTALGIISKPGNPLPSVIRCSPSASQTSISYLLSELFSQSVGFFFSALSLPHRLETLGLLNGSHLVTFVGINFVEALWLF
ncbi:hypothetical protein AMELA_G00140160 [Ameiurus melas]|uniref:Uncharacterized protein n=1 Tax=Ameiurus melas TaxID=219545 RepID=A0A7J6AML5_AMEME|nr:hypothetical protein AMELA_G00140160 [Ameiurus melas]